MKKFVFISNRIPVLENLKKCWNLIALEHQLPLEQYIFVEVTPGDNEENIIKKISVLSDVNSIFVSWMGTAQDPMIQELREYMDHAQVDYIIHFTSDTYASSGFFDCDQAIKCTQFIDYGGEKNFSNFIKYFLYLYKVLRVNFMEPVALPWSGIYFPEASHIIDLNEYILHYWENDKPTIAIFFPRENWVWNNLSAMDQLIQCLKEKKINPLPIFTHWMRDKSKGIPGFEDNLEKYCKYQGRVLPNALIQCLWFSVKVGRDVTNENFLEELDIPIIHGETLLQDVSTWNDSLQGLSDSEIQANIIMPEFDGVIHGVPYATRDVDSCTGSNAIPLGIKALAERACNWAKLSFITNKDKKIAIILHNYPPDNSNIGTAMALDSITSTEILIHYLHHDGYNVEEKEAEGWLINQITSGLSNDREFIDYELKKGALAFSSERYEEWFNNLENCVQEELEHFWGKSPGNVFVANKKILIPGIIKGNVFISVQPPRGYGENPDIIYHSSKIPPTHHYLAYYEWIRSVFCADAVIHMGTHGSLEWLPGKATGLDNKSYPYIAIGNLPNIYPYLISVVCEGVQAKRRAGAVIIDHLPAPVEESGLYGDLLLLDNAISEFYLYRGVDETCEKKCYQTICDLANKIGLLSELNLELHEKSEEVVMSLHNYLSSISDAQTRVGLHVLGKIPEGETLEKYLLAMTRNKNGENPSLPEILANISGIEYYRALEENKWYEIHKIRNICRSFIRCLIDNTFVFPQKNIIFELLGTPCTDEDLEKLKKICSYIKEKLYLPLLLTKNEMEHILDALAGKYIEPGPAGAPTAGMVDVLPTGRNFFGSDPRIMPSKSAWLLGKNMAEEMILKFVRDKGSYPKRIGMVFWSGHNMRTLGLDVAEFLALIGVKPVWSVNGRVSGVEVIAPEELKRPRIDVTVRMSGMYRDSLWPTVELMDDAIQAVIQLAEDDSINYVKMHYGEEIQKFGEIKMDQVQAHNLASARIFSSQMGTYGAGVNLALENRNWNTIDDLGKIFVNWGCYAYSKTMKGSFAPKSFEYQLATMDLTIKNEDNYEVNMLDSDDYNAFHGGMIAAVRALRGSVPESYCGDTSDGSSPKIRTLKEELKWLYRTQVLNPKFIDGMRKHGYKGAADLTSLVRHSFQWDATSDIMENLLYEQITQEYVFNEEVNHWLREVNPWGLKKMAEILLESIQRGLWEAKQATYEHLRKIYMELDGELEELADQ